MPRSRLAFMALLVILTTGVLWWTQSEKAKEGETAGDVEARVETKSRAKLRSVDPAELPDSQLATLSGRVLSRDGEPVAGASVCVGRALSAPGGWFDPEPDCVDAEATGRYELEGVVPGEVRLSAQAPGHIARAYSAGLERGFLKRTVVVPPQARINDLDIRLGGPAVSLRGVVEDLAGGVIEGAVVSGGARRTIQGDASSRALTDAEGRFEIWVPAGEVSLSATAEGYTQRSKIVRAPGTEARLRLTPASAIEGVVVDAASGHPVPGVEVSAGGRRSIGVSTRSDAEGKFRLDGLAPGRHSLVATGPEHYGQLSGIRLNFASTEQVRIELYPAVTVSGQIVLGKEGQGCAGGSVRMRPVQAQQWYMENADQSGVVEIEGVLPGSYELSASCRGTVSPEIPESIEVGAEALTDQTWVVEPGHVLRGTLKDDSGAPIVGHYVLATAPGKARSRTFRAEVFSPDGSWELHGVPSGTLSVKGSEHAWTFGGDAGEVQEVEVPEEGEAKAIDLVMATRGSIRGRVVDTDGNGVGGVTIRGQGESWSGVRGTTDDQGNFELEKVSPGNLRIVASKNGKRLRAPGTHDDDKQGELVTVRAGEVTEVELVVSATSGFIAGIVYGADGAPVPDAFVRATRLDDSEASNRQQQVSRARSGWGNWGNDPVLTGPDGRFQIVGLVEGSYVLRAFHREGGDAVLEDVELGSDVELTIPRLGRIEGTVERPGGDPPIEFRVSVHDKTTGIRVGTSFFRTDGNFEIEGLAAGEYELTVDSVEGAGELEDKVQVAEGETVAGLVVRLSEQVTLTGVLVDDETGEPVAKMVASAGLGNATKGRGMAVPGMPTVTDASGRFVVDKVERETKNLRLMPLDFKDTDYLWLTIPIEIPAAGNEHDLGEIRIPKKRIEFGKMPGDVGFECKQRDPGVEPVDYRWLVAVVTPGGPADAAGLKVGDEVLTVDGREVTGKWSYRWGALMAVPEGRTLTLGLADGRTVRIVAGPATAR